jgi:hypothetical protein
MMASNVGLGIVVHDFAGQIIVASSKTMASGNANNEGKALAVGYAIRSARYLGLHLSVFKAIVCFCFKLLHLQIYV